MTDSSKTQVLSALMQARLREDEPPYTLVLGSGFSCKVVSNNYSQFQNLVDSLERLSPDERYAILVQSINKSYALNLYRSLAKLIQLGYFNIIISAYPGNELESSLLEVGASLSDFEVLVMGRDHDIKNRLESRSPKVKLIKVRGDLLSRSLGTIAPNDALKMGQKYEFEFSKLLERDAIVVGVQEDDYDLYHYLKISISSLWLVAEKVPMAGQYLHAILHSRSSGKVIHYQNPGVDAFFDELLSSIGNYPDISISNNDWLSSIDAIQEKNEEPRKLVENTGNKEAKILSNEYIESVKDAHPNRSEHNPSHSSSSNKQISIPALVITFTLPVIIFVFSFTLAAIYLPDETQITIVLVAALLATVLLIITVLSFAGILAPEQTKELLDAIIKMLSGFGKNKSDDNSS